MASKRVSVPCISQGLTMKKRYLNLLCTDVRPCSQFSFYKLGCKLRQVKAFSSFVLGKTIYNNKTCKIHYIPSSTRGNKGYRMN